MDRWDYIKNCRREIPQIDIFLAEIIEVCRKYNLSISHEDSQGGFIIEPASEENFRWLLDAAAEVSE